MADSSFLSQFLREALLGIVLAIVLGRIGTSRLRARRTDDAAPSGTARSRMVGDDGIEPPTCPV